MRTIFYKSSSPTRMTPPVSPLHHTFYKSTSLTRMTPPVSPLHHTFSESLMEENIETAELIITKWDPLSDKNSTYCNIASLFSGNNREDANQYLSSVTGLQKAMQYLVSHLSATDKLVKAQNLMQTAMKRLEREFYTILKSNRDYLDPESVSVHSSSGSRPSPSRSSFSDYEEESENERDEDESIPEVERVSLAAMADLKAIADAMISAGYTRECIKIYKSIRKSIVDEALHRLGVESFTFQQIQKMDWDVLEVKIKNWLKAVKMAVKTLFYGERILCDNVFSVSDKIIESCFMEISKEGALSLFGFPENVAKCKKAPEKMFRILDMYEAISDLLPEVESIFYFESTSNVRSTAVNSLIRLGDAVRTMLTDFEAAIQKDSSKSTIPGGGVHPLTRYVMNYITFLADYSEILSDIVADWPLNVPSPLPESYFGSPDNESSISSPISVRLAWLILVMLCKLDGKAEHYKDVALSYLFLANNLQYVVGKVRQSNLKFLLGNEWVAKHEQKVRQYASNYERVGWSKVLASLPEHPTANIPVGRVKDYFRKFNLAFEEAYTKQTPWVVPDPKLRDDIKNSLARRIVPIYKEFYEKYGGSQSMSVESLIRYTPDDLGNYWSDLFYGGGSSGSVSSNSSRDGRRLVSFVEILRSKRQACSVADDTCIECI